MCGRNRRLSRRPPLSHHETASDVTEAAIVIERMDRRALENLSLVELRQEMIRLGLTPAENIAKCIDKLMDHRGDGPPPLLDTSNNVVPPLAGASMAQATAHATHPADQALHQPAESSALPADPIQQLCIFFAAQMKQQQDFMQQIMSTLAPHSVSTQLSTSNAGYGIPAAQAANNNVPYAQAVPGAGYGAPPQQGFGNTGPSSQQPQDPFSPLFSARQPLATKTSMQAVSLLSTQLPGFKGSEDEDVELWLQKVEDIAAIHGVSPEIALLAASAKLSDTARKWLDLSSSNIRRSWATFKQALSDRFRRTVMYHVQIQKVEARKWMFTKESFQDYAMDKLTLIEPLKLPEKESIQLLINGIQNSALRSVATALRTITIDEFLNEMHSIALSYGDNTKKISPANTGKEKGKTAQGTTEKSDSTSKISKNQKDVFCVYCRAKGHLRADCYKLKKKEQQSRPTSSPTASSAVAVVEEEKKDVDATVSLVTGKDLIIKSSVITVTLLNDLDCNLTALLDTGSPVSFICPLAYKKFGNRSLEALNMPHKSFWAINGSPVKVSGIFTTNIKLAALPDLTAIIKLHVLENTSFSTDIVIGRDFIQDQKLSVHFYPSGDDLESRLQLFNEVAPVAVDEIFDTQAGNMESIISDIDIDFDSSIKDKLAEVLREVDKAKVAPVDDGHTVLVTLKDTSTYAYAPRRFAYGERQQVREITDDLLHRGIIKPSVSPYCARVVPVRKKNGSMRLCVDLRPLNDRVVKQKCPFPLVEDCLARLGNKKVFTLLDLKDGFHQIRIHPDCTKFFSFATPDGQFEYLRLPFGFCEAPAEFQKRLVMILQSFIRDDQVLVYMDDILIATISIEENLQILKEVLRQLKRYGFVLNFNKCCFLKNSVEYLGYILTKDGITMSQRHTEAVRNFPVPTKQVEVQRFLGLCNYFRKFVPKYTDKARPLQNLLRKSIEFHFDENCLDAFNLLKEKLTSFPVLKLYNPQLPTELHTDASALALAAILLQKQENGSWAPIAFFSQATNKAESKYHSFELEMLAIVRAIERFHIYLYGLEFVVITDCNALVYAINKAHLNPRIARWTLALQNYRFKIQHRPGTRMAHVDALSRAVSLIHLMPLEKELQYRQLQDGHLKTIAENLESSEHEKYELFDGLVYRKGPDKPRFVVPESMISNILRVYHDNFAHCGIEKVVQGIRANYWFPSMRKRAQNHVENCLVCLMANASTNAREGEMQLTDSPSEPFTVLHTDHFGPITESIQGPKHILLMVDAFTRFTWLFAVNTVATEEVIPHFVQLFQIFGNPKLIISDRGTAFTSRVFAEFLENRNIRHRKIAVGAAWANGIVERVNRFLKSSLKKIIESPQTWPNSLEKVQYVINNTYHSSISASPSKLLLGYDSRNNLDAELVRKLNQIANVSVDPTEERESSRKLAMEVESKIKAYNKTYYDKRHTKPSKYKPNDFVLIRDTTVKTGEGRKFKPNYKGPYLVSKVLNKNRYVITDIPGFNVSQRPYDSILSTDRMKLWSGKRNG